MKLPYQGSDIVAIAVLPDERKYGFNVDAALADVGISRLLDADWDDASLAEPSLRVSMPKFKVKLDMLPVGKVGGCLATALQTLNRNTRLYSPVQFVIVKLDIHATDMMCCI